MLPIGASRFRKLECHVHIASFFLFFSLKNNIFVVQLIRKQIYMKNIKTEVCEDSKEMFLEIEQTINQYPNK